MFGLHRYGLDTFGRKKLERSRFVHKEFQEELSEEFMRHMSLCESFIGFFMSDDSGNSDKDKANTILPRLHMSEALFLSELSLKSFNEIDDSFMTPFGAVVAFNGAPFGVGVSTVTITHDPTDHAEMWAIRQACARLGTHDLSGAVLYSSAHPCPMCLTAARWAGIDKIVYAADLDHSASAGFQDAQFFEQLGGADLSQWCVQTDDVDMRDRAHEILASWKEIWETRYGDTRKEV